MKIEGSAGFYYYFFREYVLDNPERPIVDSIRFFFYVKTIEFNFMQAYSSP